MARYRTIITYTISALVLSVTLGTVVMAQYNWSPINARVAKWLTNNIHMYKNNVGSVVVGGLHPDVDLLLDVNGAIGATNYCSQLDTDCFPAEQIKWRATSTNDQFYSAGNVGIGTNTPSQDLEVSGNVLATAFQYPSDVRLKHDIQPLDGLETVSQLEGVRFVWNESGNESIGFIAQKVEEVLPELVHTDPVSGYKSVEYLNLVAVLVAALQEQQEEIDLLRHDIAQYGHSL